MALHLLISAALLLSLGLCDIQPSFIFPPNSTYWKNDTTIANVSVHFNDNITIEYLLPNTFGHIRVQQLCYPSITPLQHTSWSNADSFPNTGILNWNVGNGNNGNHTNISICQLAISNYTITTCAWGPWGLLNWNQTYGTLMYSQLFNISAAGNGTKPSLVTSGKTPTVGRVAAMPVAVTCPPSGVPASPLYTPVPVVEQIPPWGDNVTFPH